MSAPDAENIRKIEKRLKQAATNLHAMEDEVATALTVIEYDSDRRKNLLAEFSAPLIKEGESAAAAEVQARANKDYQERFQKLFGQYEMAQKARKAHDDEKISWESARSLLARQRETIKTLPGTED